jgi:hypothetical protein
MRRLRVDIAMKFFIIIVFSCLHLTKGFALGAYCSGSNPSDVAILDNGSWVFSSITISCAPADAVVTGIDVHLIIAP